MEGARRVLVLSDVHGHCGLRRALAAARREAPVDALVLLGDFWEAGGPGCRCEEWRLAVSRVVEASGAAFTVYIAGNHDEAEAASRWLEGVVNVVSRDYTVAGSDVAFYLTHGHRVEREWLEECLWSEGFTGPGAAGCVVEWGRRARRALGLPGSVWLVLGHSHRLIVDEEGRVVHAGALCERILPRLSLDWRESLGYVVLRDPWVEVRRVNPRGELVASTHTWPGEARVRGRSSGLLARLRGLLGLP